MTGELKVLNRTGHTTVEWSTDLRDTVEEANRRFNELLAQGYTAFAMEDGTSGRHITAFDETAETVILVPRMVGG
jgi:hypothetical protein